MPDQVPEKLKAVHYAEAPSEAPHAAAPAEARTVETRVDGIDVYVAWPSADPNTLAAKVEPASGDGLKLTMISNRGVKVWPEGFAETFCTDSFRCRFTAAGGTTVTKTIALLARVDALGLDIVKTEGLRTFDGQPGYSLAQGQ